MAFNPLTYPNKSFKKSPVVLLIIFLVDLCFANGERYHNHLHHQKQKTSHRHHHHSHSDKQRNRRDQTFHNFNSVDRIYDLSHSYFDGMPLEEGAIPLELSLVKQDVGEGAR